LEQETVIGTPHRDLPPTNLRGLRTERSRFLLLVAANAIYAYLSSNQADRWSGRTQGHAGSARQDK
jgi:hypothetical protein